MPSLRRWLDPRWRPPTPRPGVNPRAASSTDPRGALPPVDPLGWSDVAAAPRRAIFPPTGHDLAIAGALVVGGVAWGAALAFAQSLPSDFGFLLFVLQVGVGLVFLLSLLFQLLFRGFNVDRVAIIAVLVLGGSALGLVSGPTAAPAVTVSGSYVFTPTLPTAPASQGALACQWASGRWRIGLLTTTTPIAGLPTPHVLAVNFLQRRVELADGAASTLLAVGDAAVAPPPDETARGAGDRTGAIAIDVLQVNLASGSSEVNEVRGTFRWTCSGPPPD